MPSPRDPLKCSYEVRLWSFSTGKVVQTLELPKDLVIVTFLEFTGTNRVIVGGMNQSTYLVYDVEAGKQHNTIEVEPQHNKKFHALSPGGNYLAVYKGSKQPLAIYDTRNGVRAGRLEIDTESYASPECLAFSADGKELAGYFEQGSKTSIQVWDMTDGSSIVTHRFAESPDRQLGHVRYQGRQLEWLADRSGWLLFGVAVVDRESGEIVWQDQEAIDSDDVLARRIVDTKRMLVFRKGEGTQTLCLVSIPIDEIAKSRSIVAAGGTAADTGLPPVAETNRSGAKQLALSRVPWSYQAAVSKLSEKALLRNRLSLGAGPVLHKTFFSGPEAARLAVGRKLDASKATWDVHVLVPQACDLYDLQSGQQIGQFAIPFPTEFMDLSPDGRLGLFRIHRDKDRLDIWDLASGKHLLGFRPFEGDSDREREVDVARFVDGNHLVTLSKAGELVGWNLPECRAVYVVPPRFRYVAGMTRDRRTMVVVERQTPHLVDALSGRMLGTLPIVESDESIVRPQASFSPDENRLAILSQRDEGVLLVAWDLTDQTVLLKLDLPFDAYGLVWCGSQHILLNRSLGSEDPDAMVDIERGQVVWSYELANGDGLWASPDHRFWFVNKNHSLTASELCSIELPDEQVKSLLSQVRAPDPLIGPDRTVAVRSEIASPPQEIPPGWSHLKNLNDVLSQHFTKQLTDKQVNVVARADVQLVVGVEQKKMERTMSVGGLLSPSRQVLISATFLTPFISVLDSKGSRVWSKRPSDDDREPVDLNDCPEGMDKETYVKLEQWQNAVQWLRTVDIPSPLFHPQVQHGYGESEVTPEGTKVRRSPSPAQTKPPGKTA